MLYDSFPIKSYHCFGCFRTSFCACADLFDCLHESTKLVVSACLCCMCSFVFFALLSLQVIVNQPVIKCSCSFIFDSLFLSAVATILLVQYDMKHVCSSLRMLHIVSKCTAVLGPKVSNISLLIFCFLLLIRLQVTGCSFTTIARVSKQMLLTGGDREPPPHGLKKFWNDKGPLQEGDDGCQQAAP